MTIIKIYSIAHQGAYIAHARMRCLGFGTRTRKEQRAFSKRGHVVEEQVGQLLSKQSERNSKFYWYSTLCSSLLGVGCALAIVA